MEDQKKNNKKLRTYNNCPLCKGYFHSAKTCIFRKHALHFKDMEQQIKQLTISAKDDTKPAELLLPTQTINKDEDKDSGSETDFEDSTMEDDQPVLLFDQILKIVQAMSSRKEAATKQEEDDNMLDFTQQVKMFEPEQQGTSCELTKEKFTNSICKILPDGAEFPEDLFNIE